MSAVTHQCARLVLLGEDGENPPAGVPSLLLFTEERTTIGRSRTADITMDSERYPMTLSRSHLCIWREYISSGNYQWHVADLNALNGTFIGCVKVGDSALHDGEILTMGGGAGLELGERSDLLASDLVFRFEVIFDDDNDEKGAPDSPSSSSAPPRAPSTTPGERASSSDAKNKAKAKDKEPTAMPPPSSGNTAERNGEANKSKANKKDDTSFKTSSAALAVSANVTKSQAREAIDNEEGDVLAAQQQLFRESMLAEVKCAVCCDFFFNACTLGCSHSFCQTCIEECLYRKHECPVCRSVVTSRPVRSNHLDNIVKTLMNTSERKELDARAARLHAHAERQTSALDSLQTRLADAAMSEKFLKITHEWTGSERATFVTGVNQYRGEARKLYCDATGLTSEFLECSSLEMLLLAAVNVGMYALEEAGGIGAGDLRRKMQMFIMYGLSS